MARRLVAVMLVAAVLTTAACTGSAASDRTAGRPTAVPTAGASQSSTAPSPSPSPSYPPYQKAVVPPADVNHLRRGPANPAVGVAYPFDIYAHCGAELVRFGGSNWRADQPLQTTAESYIAGTMELPDADTARFALDLRYLDQLAISGPPVEVVIYHQTTDAVGCM